MSAASSPPEKNDSHQVKISFALLRRIIDGVASGGQD